MIFWRTDLPDWTTLSLIPVVIGLSFMYLQFHEILLLYLLIVYIPNGQLFLLPLGKVGYTEINSLACLKFSPPNMLFPYLQRMDWKLWSSGVGYRIQETCPKSAVVKTPINWKREGCSEQVWSRKHWFLQSTSFQPSSLLWMVRRLCPQVLVISTFHSTSLLVYSRSVTLKNTKSFIQLLGPEATKPPTKMEGRGTEPVWLLECHVALGTTEPWRWSLSFI